MFKLLTIIVTYNGEKWLDKCIGSLANSSINTEIFCIDNCSTDRTVELLRKKYSYVNITQLEKNIGFGQANNIGLAYAKGNNFDYAFLLNQDAWVDEITIEELVRISSENKMIGVLSPIHLDGSGTKVDFRFSKHISETDTDGLFSDLIMNNSLKDFYRLPFVNAAAWLLPISTIKIIGGFDPLFFHYGEDDNYCQRIKYHGLYVGVTPNVYIMHDRTQSLDNYHKNDSFEYFDILLKIKISDVNNLNFDRIFSLEIGKVKTPLLAAILVLDLKSIKRYLKRFIHLISLKSALHQSYIKNKIRFSNYLE